MEKHSRIGVEYGFRLSHEDQINISKWRRVNPIIWRTLIDRIRYEPEAALNDKEGFLENL
jgi:hypothetical protein